MAIGDNFHRGKGGQIVPGVDGPAQEVAPKGGFKPIK